MKGWATKKRQLPAAWVWIYLNETITDSIAGVKEKVKGPTNKIVGPFKS